MDVFYWASLDTKYFFKVRDNSLGIRRWDDEDNGGQIDAGTKKSCHPILRIIFSHSSKFEAEELKVDLKGLFKKHHGKVGCKTGVQP